MEALQRFKRELHGTTLYLHMALKIQIQTLINCRKKKNKTALNILQPNIQPH